MINQTTVLILAGGACHRFAPLVTDKTMLQVMGKPLIQHTLEALERVGFSDIVITTNQHNHDFLTNFSSNLHIQTISQKKSSGMADAVLTARKIIKHQPLLIINATDFFADKIFINLMKQIKLTKAEAILTAKEQTEYFDGGYLQIEGDHLIGIIEKPGPGKRPSDLVNLVFHWFKKPSDFIETLTSTQSTGDDVYEQALSAFIKQNIVSYLPYEGDWQAVKYPHMIHQLTQLFLNSKLQTETSSSARIHPTATIEGPVFIDKHVVIEAGAVIKGPVYIGENTIIGNHTLIRNSIIESDCIVGFGSEIARSYIGPGCKLHHNFIGDSVLEKDVNPSYGTCFANLRLDNQPISISYPQGKVQTNLNKFGAVVASQVFLGVNCSVMPGTTIGCQAQAYPGQIIKGYISSK